MITNQKTNRDSKFRFLILFLALAISANTPSLHADIIVDPNNTGATDFTDLFPGNPLDPTVGVLTPAGLAVGQQHRPVCGRRRPGKAHHRSGR